MGAPLVGRPGPVPRWGWLGCFVVSRARCWGCVVRGVEWWSFCLCWGVGVGRSAQGATQQCWMGWGTAGITPSLALGRGRANLLGPAVTLGDTYHGCGV